MSLPPLRGAAYAQARARLQAVTVRAVRPGLDRTRRLLAFLGHPDQIIPMIQITGTNGKGSVAALADSALQAAGLCVGRFTSPHLADERERIAINGKPVSRTVFAAAVRRLLPELERMHRAGNPATAFEAWTALAAEVFRACRVGIAVMEVGMGGRLDATTAWQRTVLSVLTQVGLDHTAELGSTKEAICREKLGITRPGVLLVTGEGDPRLRRLIRQTGRQKCFPIRFAGIPGDHAWAESWNRIAAGLRVAVNLHGKTLKLAVTLAGSFQVGNILLAALAVASLAEAGFPVSAQAMRHGFRTVTWPGRLEKVRSLPDVYLDGGHNPEAALALAREWRERGKNVFLVMGVMKDKDASSMIKALAPVAGKVWTVSPPDADRAMPAEELAQLWRSAGHEAQAARSYRQALARALQTAGQRGTVLVAGSLYNIAPARRALKHWEADAVTRRGIRVK